MDSILRMYNFYKREMNIEDSPYLHLFEGLLHDTPFSIFECAPQLTPSSIHPARFRIAYKDQKIRDGISAAGSFLEKIHRLDIGRPNCDAFKIFADGGLELSSLEGVGIGIDIRKNADDSKVKCYFETNGVTEKIKELLLQYPPSYKLEDYIDEKGFMFGLNMYFDGRTDVEVYHHIPTRTQEDLERLKRLELEPALKKFKNEYQTFGVSFDSLGNRVLHFYSLFPTRFARLSGNLQLVSLYSNTQVINYLLKRSGVKKYVGVIFSFMESEVLTGEIMNANLAYSLNVSLQDP